MLSQLMEEELPPSPKRRGQKPKPVAAKVDDVPTKDMAEAPGTKTADKPTGNTHIGSKLKSKKAPVPSRDPLPAQEGRNTHPGVHFGLQPSPCRSSQQVVPECEQKRQELEAQVQAAEAVKQQLALMDLEDERIEEVFEEKVDSDEEDSPSPEPEKEVKDKGKGKGKGTARKLASRALCKDIEEMGKGLHLVGGKKGVLQQGGEDEARFNFSLADLLPKKYNQAGADTTTMGYFIPESAIGGLDDDQVATKHPASFGPISSQAMPNIPLGLQRDCSQGNKLVGFSCGVEGENGWVAVICPHGNVTTKAPKKVKLKIRALTQQQGNIPPNPSVAEDPLIPDAQYFISQPTWSKVFLPSLAHLFMISEQPFQSFKNNSAQFVAIVQEAFDVTHPNISYTVTACNDIVTMSFDRLKTKRLLIASDFLKLVKTYFKNPRFVDREEVTRHVWWALRPDGLAYHAKPAPIDVKDTRSVYYIHPEGRYWSEFISLVAKKFLALAVGSAVSPPIVPHNLPIGLYTLILTAVERTFKSFRDGTFRVPLQFSNEYTWQAIESFCKLLANLQPEQWGHILNSLGVQDKQHSNHMDHNDFKVLSMYRGGLVNFGSPLKGQI
ncbi:hypothetical protein V8E53_001514 [Lactarius tabidus]